MERKLSISIMNMRERSYSFEVKVKFRNTQCKINFYPYEGQMTCYFSICYKQVFIK